MERTTIDLWFGAFVAAGFAALLVLALKVGNLGAERAKDTTASILTSGLLGDTYVGLEAGGDEKKLAEGDRIQLTQSAVVLEKLIGQFLFSKAQEDAPAKK